MPKFRSFTLVEMVIVIMIVGIMLGITLNISSHQTKELRFRIARENFLTNYNSFIIKAITTNRDDLELSFVQGVGSMITGNDSSLYFEPVADTIINNILIGGVPVGADGIFTTQRLSFDSSQGECVLNAGTGEIRDDIFEIILKYQQGNVETKSYIIDLATCKMRRGTNPEL